MKFKERFPVLYFILRGIGRFITLFVICATVAGTAICTVSISSSERTERARYEAQEAEAVARHSENQVMLKAKEAEMLRHEVELKKQCIGNKQKAAKK